MLLNSLLIHYVHYLSENVEYYIVFIAMETFFKFSLLEMVLMPCIKF